MDISGARSVEDGVLHCVVLDIGRIPLEVDRVASPDCGDGTEGEAICIGTAPQVQAMSIGTVGSQRAVRDGILA